ncbi:MAG: hypothetical protein KDC44_03355 [Phaeodactylibacter sp.]|nr:hypothetical protein [Phaeodactylibacter sp.]
MKRRTFLFLFLLLNFGWSACTQLLPTMDYGELVGVLQENKIRAEELVQLVEQTCGATTNRVETRLLYAEVRARQNGLIQRMVTDLQTWNGLFDREGTRSSYNTQYEAVEEALDILLDRSEKLVRNNCGIKRFVPFSMSVKVDLGNLLVEVYKDLMGDEMRQQLIAALETTRLEAMPVLVNSRMELATD